MVVGVVGPYDADRHLTAAFIAGASSSLVDLLYFVGLWTSGLQATLGMRLLHLRVLGADRPGRCRSTPRPSAGSA